MNDFSIQPYFMQRSIKEFLAEPLFQTKEFLICKIDYFTNDATAFFINKLNKRYGEKI